MKEQKESGGEERQEDDDGGHIIARILGGAEGEENLVPMRRTINRGDYKKMENENTIIFYVAQKANKQEIKAAFNEAFGVKPEKVNTMNTILGRKKAFIKLPKTSEATEIANKIGLI